MLFLYFGVALAVIGIDQLTKFLVYGTIARSIIGNVLWFESSLNTGVAFSMFEGKSYIFIITAFIASAVLVWLIISKKFLPTKFEKISMALVLGGALSNAIDRIIFKGVRDFIYLKFINFAIFNVADMAINIGAILLILAIILPMIKKKDKEEKDVGVKH